MGGCLCSCGQLLHGAAPVTRGVRYVLIAFIDEQQLPPDDSDADEHDDEDEEEGEREAGAAQGVAEQREAAHGVTGGLSEHTQLLMDAGEAELRGFRPDEEVVMPLPVWSDSDDED